MKIVYFVQRESDRNIKIGFSAEVEQRLIGIATKAKCKVHLLGVIPGGRAEERKLHRTFAWVCESGEWFINVPQLMRFIEENAVAYERPADARVAINWRLKPEIRVLLKSMALHQGMTTEKFVENLILREAARIGHSIESSPAPA